MNETAVKRPAAPTMGMVVVQKVGVPVMWIAIGFILGKFAFKAPRDRR